jgi:hypothetical protein
MLEYLIDGEKGIKAPEKTITTDDVRKGGQVYEAPRRVPT